MTLANLEAFLEAWPHWPNPVAPRTARLPLAQLDAATAESEAVEAFAFIPGGGIALTDRALALVERRGFSWEVVRLPRDAVAVLEVAAADGGVTAVLTARDREGARRWTAEANDPEAAKRLAAALGS